jgi:hypothetical protein
LTHSGQHVGAVPDNAVVGIPDWHVSALPHLLGEGDRWNSQYASPFLRKGVVGQKALRFNEADLHLSPKSLALNEASFHGTAQDDVVNPGQRFRRKA